jgi:hypothetical protein
LSQLIHETHDNFFKVVDLLLKGRLKKTGITGLLKIFDIRKVQYLAGHKYVSSTEDYKANVIDELQDDVTKYHPF